MAEAKTTPYERMAKALREGGHFCIPCGRLVELRNPGEPFAGCSECGSHRVKYLPALLPHDFTPLNVSEPKELKPL